jgi:hypothetical protein
MIAFDNGAASRDEVAAELDIAPAHATRLLKQLTSAGLVTADGDDYARTAPDTTSREDAAALFDAKFGTGASATAEAADAASESTGYAWPKPPSEVLLDYLKAEVTDAHDAPNRAKPFVNANGKLHMHSSDWLQWLVANGMPTNKREAAVPLREAGLKVRAFPLPGENRALGFYIGDAPTGTERLPRRVPQRATRTPRTPFSKLTVAQRELVRDALVGMPNAKLKGERAQLRDGLLNSLNVVDAANTDTVNQAVA